jgi:hypothetical protein
MELHDARREERRSLRDAWEARAPELDNDFWGFHLPEFLASSPLRVA